MMQKINVSANERKTSLQLVLVGGNVSVDFPWSRGQFWHWQKLRQYHSTLKSHVQFDAVLTFEERCVDRLTGVR